MSEPLIADIGGTHSRLARVVGGAVHDLRVYDNAGYGGLEQVLRVYLEDLEQAPPAAAIAVASPVRGDDIRLTNLGWSFSIEALRRRFGFDTLQVFNDFAAVALAVPLLGPDDVRDLGGGAPRPDEPVGVLGPGTGLGVSALVPRGQEWIPVATEGGHVTLPAATPEEARLLDALRRDYGHVSAERLLSGPGLALLYGMLAQDRQAAPSPETITRLAVSGEDIIAVQVLDQFLAMLGTVAGNLALTLGAGGGVYLAGGILPQLADQLAWEGFRERFVDKGRYRDYLEAIPTRLILRPNPALHGLAAYLSGNND
jgi:glucokinase